MNSMRALKGNAVKLTENEWVRREQENRSYLMKIENKYLLRNYQLEAGRYTGRGADINIMGGWEDLSCQLRGHFLGHWLSAAAIHYHEVGDMELKAKVDAIVTELEACQIDNGGEWVAAIPEKYFLWIAKGKSVWAPHYNIHKLFMGLIHVYKFMDNQTSLKIVDQLSNWFYNYSNNYSQEEFDNILDVETGGMLEVWADLYAITKDKKYEELLKRYYRRRLFEPLLRGEDVLTNMHANTTIPEVLGGAKAYEVKIFVFKKFLFYKLILN